MVLREGTGRGRCIDEDKLTPSKPGGGRGGLDAGVDSAGSIVGLGGVTGGRDVAIGGRGLGGFM